MAVLISKDNKELVVTCDCGCQDSIHIKVDSIDKNFDYYVVQSYMNGNFYRDQNSVFDTFRNKVQKIWAIIRNKDYHYSDIVMGKEEFEQFKKWINQF